MLDDPYVYTIKAILERKARCPILYPVGFSKKCGELLADNDNSPEKCADLIWAEWFAPKRKPATLLLVN